MNNKFEEVIKLVEKEREGLWVSKIPGASDFMPKGYPRVLEIRNETPEDLEEGVKEVMKVLKERLNQASP